MRKMLSFLLVVLGILTACVGQATVEEDASSGTGGEESAEVVAAATLPPTDSPATPTSEATSTTAPTSSPTDAPEPTATTRSLLDQLPIQGKAPNIANEIWLNTDEPLTLEGLEGKVVLVEFWTFG